MVHNSSTAQPETICGLGIIKGVLDAWLAGCTDYHSPRPNAWAAARPDHILTCRKDERCDRADRKQLAREERTNAKG